MQEYQDLMSFVLQGGALAVLVYVLVKIWTHFTEQIAYLRDKCKKWENVILDDWKDNRLYLRNAEQTVPSRSIIRSHNETQ